MNDTFDRSAAAAHKPRAALDWRKRMSDNVAYALLVYTALQIFVTVGALKSGSPSLLPYMALIVLVAAIIPACRSFEGHWSDMSDAEAANPAWAGTFRRDQFLLWVLAIGLPFALTAIFRLIASGF